MNPLTKFERSVLDDIIEYGINNSEITLPDTPDGRKLYAEVTEWMVKDNPESPCSTFNESGGIHQGFLVAHYLLNRVTQK